MCDNNKFKNLVNMILTLKLLLKVDKKHGLKPEFYRPIYISVMLMRPAIVSKYFSYFCGIVVEFMQY